MNNLTQIARDLRKNMTDSERVLWFRISGRQIEGARFRRQQPLGSYVVDFVCLEKKLVIEVDGGQHTIALEADQARDAWLQSEGFTVLRFWNNEALGNIDGVLETIQNHILSPSPHPLPSRAGCLHPHSSPFDSTQ